MKQKNKLINYDILLLRISFVLKRLKWLLFIIILALLVVIINKYFLNSGWINHDLILSYLAQIKNILLLIIGAVLLKRHFPNLANRVKELGPGGAKFYEQQNAESSEEITSPAEAAKEQEEKIELSTEPGRLSALNNFQLRWLLEKIYRNIFGTQIEALYLLNSFPQGLRDTDLQQIHNKHRIAAATYAFPTVMEFMRYLSAHGLVAYDSTTQVYKITDSGKLFLDYLNQEGLTAATKNH